MSASQDSSLEAVLKANSVDLLHYFERRTDRDAAADLLAETMLIAWQREPDSPEGGQAARMWLFGIARNVLKNSKRGQRRRHRLTSKLKVMLRPDDSSQAADDGAEVRDAVRRLEPELGELVRLVHWDGFSIADAGQILDLPSSTARGRYQRAKDLLRGALQEDSSPEQQHCPATLPQVSRSVFPTSEA
ncbi:RNA polymerase sigma factor [Nesterenkonia muleiensis]|uniref:RNA polymerase sigma factor n=1 Tax=Nesterenkonia muleiensis TaxID=2282648 RepID=UPI000E713EF7|nr:RNA polymerase sigma factor [Nesterenkonia muleiensis]